MSEQIVDLRTALRAVLRRRLVVLAVFVAFVVVGALFPKLQSQSHVASADVLLPPPPGRDSQGFPLRDIETEVVVATNAEVLEKAGATLQPPVPASALHGLIDVNAVSTDVLEVRAKHQHPAVAVALANAVAEEYAAYANRVQSAEADALIGELEKEAATLDGRVQDLHARIEAARASLSGMQPDSAEALGTVTTLNSLRADQDEAEQLLRTVNARLGEARLTSKLSRRGTRVIDPAASAQLSGLPVPVTAAAGGFVGLGLGALLALALAQVDRRLVRRRDIALSVGADVLASVRLPRSAAWRAVPKAQALRNLLQKWSPSPLEGAALRQALIRLGVHHDSVANELVIVVLPGDRAAHLMALEVGLVAAALSSGRGATTDLVLGGQSADELGRILEGSINKVDALRGRISVRQFTEAQVGGTARRANVTVWVCVVEPGPFVFPPSVHRPAVALAVSAGFATPDTLAATANACRETGHPVQGVVVVNPDRSDGTTGLLPPPTSAAEPARLDEHLGPNGAPTPGIPGVGTTRGVTRR